MFDVKHTVDVVAHAFGEFVLTQGEDSSYVHLIQSTNATGSMTTFSRDSSNGELTELRTAAVGEGQNDCVFKGDCVCVRAFNYGARYSVPQ